LSFITSRKMEARGYKEEYQKREVTGGKVRKFGVERSGGLSVFMSERV